MKTYSIHIRLRQTNVRLNLAKLKGKEGVAVAQALVKLQKKVEKAGANRANAPTAHAASTLEKNYEPGKGSLSTSSLQCAPGEGAPYLFPFPAIRHELLAPELLDIPVLHPRVSGCFGARCCTQCRDDGTSSLLQRSEVKVAPHDPSGRHHSAPVSSCPLDLLQPSFIANPHFEANGDRHYWHEPPTSSIRLYLNQTLGLGTIQRSAMSRRLSFPNAMRSSHENDVFSDWQ